MAYTYYDFKNSLAGCSENKYKQEKLLSYMQEDCKKFNHFFNRVLIELKAKDDLRRIDYLLKSEE